MTRNLKMLGLALVAVFALSVVLGQAAMAEKTVQRPYQFISDGDWTSLSAAQGAPGDVFETDAKLPIKCSTAAYSGSIGETAPTTLTLTPAYSGCTFGGFAADVITTGCSYVIHADQQLGTETEGGAIDWENKYQTTTTIDCSAGKDITVIATQAGITKCTVHIPPQDMGTGVTLTNEETGGGVKDIKSHIEFSNIKYSQTEGTGLGKCATADNTTNGKYVGSNTISGKNTTSENTSIWMEEVLPLNFKSEAEDTIVIGETATAEEFIVTAGTAKCTESVYKGTIASKSVSEVTLAPEYGGCTAFGFSSAEINLNGCTYVFHSGNKAGGTLEGKLDIKCPEGKSMEIVAKVLGLTKCVVTIGAQTGLTAVTYTNEGSGATRDVKIDIGATGIKYTQDTGEGLGKCSSGTFETGKYNGVATGIGENSKKEQVGFWVE